MKIIEDNEFLNQLDIEHSYVGTQAPMIEVQTIRPILQELQDKPWYEDTYDYLPEDSGMTIEDIREEG